MNERSHLFPERTSPLSWMGRVFNEWRGLPLVPSLLQATINVEEERTDGSLTVSPTSGPSTRTACSKVTVPLSSEGESQTRIPISHD